MTARPTFPTRNQSLLSEQRSLELWQRQGLTRREADVLRWLTIGKTNPEISIILGISRLTVKTHVAHIFAKLDVETRTAASVRAMELLRDPAAKS